MVGDKRMPINDFLQHIQSGSTIRFAMIDQIKYLGNYMNGNLAGPGAKIQSEWGTTLLTTSIL